MALVIGNSNYAHGGRLANPVNDAAMISAALKKVGFTVIDRTDLGRDALESALESFARDSAGADIESSSTIPVMAWRSAARTT